MATVPLWPREHTQLSLVIPYFNMEAVSGAEKSGVDKGAVLFYY